MLAVHHHIATRPTSQLLPARRNARTHSRKQIRKIADSIERFGFVTPILIDNECRIVAGHGRWEAAKLLDRAEVPTLELTHLNAEERRAYALADNQLAALAGWDRELLSLEIAELEIAMPELDLRVTGFEIEQLEIIRDLADAKRPTPAASIDDAPQGPAVTRVGDLWHIGEHRLLCGDALLTQSYHRLLDGALADVVISDLPYNVPILGHVRGQAAHREFEMASGEMTRIEFQRFLSAVCRQLVRHSRSGSLHFLFMDWRSIADLIAAGEEHFAELLNVIVWVKPNEGMGSLYRSRHELVALFRHGSRAHINNVQLGAHGRNRTNVWEYAGINGFGADRELGTMHPTVKNVDMIADAILDASRANDIILDPFGGSGTTMVAAHRTRRRAGLIELDPLYCDLCIKRAIGEGLQATLAATGDAFDAVARHRPPFNAADDGGEQR